jgi:hypothetical protein
MPKKSSLKDKELTKLKKIVKKLKEAKKRKRKQRRNDGVTQKVSQKVIIGSNVKENKATENVGRSFPQIQFLPQTQSQSLDTQLLRDLLLQKNMSPLTREVKESVSIRPSYDLADQYGLNLNTPVTLGLQTEPVSVPVPPTTNNNIELPRFDDDSNNTDIVTLEPQQQIMNDEETIRYFENVLKPPPEPQGNLDTPLKEPEPIRLGQSIFDSGNETERRLFYETPKRSKSKKVELVMESGETDVKETPPTTTKKKRGPRGKYTKTLEREKMEMEDKMGKEGI